MSYKKYRLKILAVTSLMLPTLVWSAGESCNALLNLGLYNVTQSSSAADGESMSKSTFCSADYSKIDESSSQAVAIKASYGLFSGGASGSASSRQIQETQSSVCTSGFSSSAYSNQASDYARVVYQGSLDAWNKCQQLANKGLAFEVQPSSTLQGVSVTITAPTGLAARFSGVQQYGVGQSNCQTTINGKIINFSKSNPLLAVPFKFTAASRLTLNCTRQMDTIGNDLIADAQDLVFVTSADNLTVPLAEIGSLSRASVDQIKADVTASINQAKIDNQNAITAQKAWVGNVPISTMQNYHPGCILDLSRLPQCNSAAQTYCQANNYGTIGIIQQWGSDYLVVGCIK
jgi:hypothetical protein